jgi:hypothetical protein
MVRSDRYVRITGSSEGLPKGEESYKKMQQLRNHFHQKESETKLATQDLILNSDKLNNEEDAFTIIACTQSSLKLGNRQEEDGVHFHSYANGEVRRDATYRKIIIDGNIITPYALRYLAMQRDLKLEGVASCNCPKCKTQHLDIDYKAFHRHKIHKCNNQNCGIEFETEKPIISNPLVKIFNNYV